MTREEAAAALVAGPPHAVGMGVVRLPDIVPSVAVRLATMMRKWEDVVRLGVDFSGFIMPGALPGEGHALLDICALLRVPPVRALVVLRDYIVGACDAMAGAGEWGSCLEVARHSRVRYGAGVLKVIAWSGRTYPSVVLEQSERVCMWVSPHRFMCWLDKGVPDDPGLFAHHVCDYKTCVNPVHLVWSTPGANTREVDAARYAAVVEAQRGHAATQPRDRRGRFAARADPVWANDDDGF